jgi:hypothetical protein
MYCCEYGSWPYIIRGWKSLLRTDAHVFSQKFTNYGREKFYNVGPPANHNFALSAIKMSNPWASTIKLFVVVFVS